MMRIRQMKRYPLISRGSAWIVGLVFLWASVNKILQPADFALSVFRYHLVPPVLINLISLMMAWLELSCAGCVLFIPKMRKPALLFLLILLLIFTLTIMLNIFRGTHVACGCFSTSPFARPLGWINVLRNVGLIALSSLALLPKKSRWLKLSRH